MNFRVNYTHGALVDGVHIEPYLPMVFITSIRMCAIFTNSTGDTKLWNNDGSWEERQDNDVQFGLLASAYDTGNYTINMDEFMSVIFNIVNGYLKEFISLFKANHETSVVRTT